jgi:type II secretory pathway component GspD/PulD (secretin)
MRAETLARIASAWWTCMALVALVCVAASVAAAQGTITGIDVANQADRVIITVQGDRALSMTPLVSSSGKYLGFQFPHRLAAKGRLVRIHSGSIYNVRYSSFRSTPPATRIVINTSSHVDYSTNRSPDRKRLEICVMKLRSAAAPKQEAQAPAIKPLPAATAFDQRPVRVASASVLPISALPVIAPEPAGAEPEVRVRGVSEVVTSEPQEPAPGEPRIEAVQTAQLGGAASLSRGVSVVARVPVTQPPAQPERRVSLNFLGADINDVLKALSVQSGHNIVASTDVKGNVTVSLNGVTVEQALDYVAKLSGYAYTKDNDTYLVAAKDSLSSLTGTKAEESVVEVLTLRYINVDEVLSLLKNQYPEVQASKVTRAARGHVGGMKLDPSVMPDVNNQLVLLGVRSKVEVAKELITRLDESMKTQTMEEVTSIYHIRYVSVPEMAKTLMALVPGIKVALAPSEGFSLNAPTGIALSSSGAKVEGTTDPEKVAARTDRNTSGAGKDDSVKSSTFYAGDINADTKSQALIIVGRESDVKKAMDLAAQLDVKSPQIKIDAKITSLTESGQKKLGVTWDWSSVDFSESLAPGAKGSGQWIRGAFDFRATLDALIKDGDGQLLASPSLVCLEGKPGVFFVGDEVTYIQRIEVTATGQNIVTDTKQVGVQLRVIGNASTDGYITLNLHPEVSVLKLSVEQGVSLPIVARRFTDHVVRVKDGQTIVIGGLIRNDEIAEMSKVPVVGDLPILGNLFRHKNKTKDRTEVVMFITASVLTD